MQSLGKQALDGIRPLFVFQFREETGESPDQDNVGHLEIADDVHISAGTLVAKSIRSPGTYSGTVPFLEHREWLRNFAHIRHLEAMSDRIRALETRLATLENRP